MIDFSNVKSIFIPEGEVSVIARGSEVLWRKQRYKRELAYLESTDTQWIDTGYIPNGQTAVEMVVSGISKDSFALSASGTWFAGARAGYMNKAFGFYYNPTEKKMYYAFGNVMQSGSYTSLYGETRKIHASASGLYIDDTKVVSANEGNFVSPVSLSLFGLNNNGSVISFTKFRLHSCKLWDNGTLVRDFIPVLDMDDVQCMFDKVSGRCFYNQGAGTFLYGEISTERLPAEYQEVAYLEGTGTQYIDTGVTINTSTDEVEFVFQNTESVIYKWFFGEHDNNARFGLGSGDGVNKRNVAYGSNTYKVTDAQLYNSQHSFSANANGIYLDDSKIAGFVSFASSSTLYLFNLNLNSGNYAAAAKVWSYRHTRNGVSIRDLVPCYRKSDSKPGMFDLVTNEFFTNAGTGEFLYGIEGEL